MSKISLLLNRMIPHSLERKLRFYRDNSLRIYKEQALDKEIYSQQNYYKISFCITCMNRLFHLKRTLEKNLLDNQSYPSVEFVLIDYNSQDGLEEYVKNNLSQYIDSGLLHYYKTSDPSIFHASKAKNLSHALAKGEIVCNLDGDNYTGREFAFYINYLFNREGFNKIYQFHKPPFWGTVGRLCLSKSNFEKLGGYDEDFLPIGHEDLDLVNRGKALGLSFERIEIENFLRYLSNTTIEKSINCSEKAEHYYDMETKNRATSEKNLERGFFRANTQGMESVSIFRNFEAHPYLSRELIQDMADKATIVPVQGPKNIF